MEILKTIGGFTLVAAIWMGVPAVILFPIASRMASHTSVSVDAIVNGYGFAIAILWIPTGVFVDFLFRKFILKKRIEN